MAGSGDGNRDHPDASVADLLKNLNLTAEEEEVAAFSDDEEEIVKEVVEWALVGKVLSPTTVHPSAVYGAMKPAWGESFWLENPNNWAQEREPFSGGVRFQAGYGESPWWITLGSGEACSNASGV